MSLGREQVHELALLARLKIERDELDQITGDLSRIIGFVEQLGQIDTTGVEPMSHPLGELTQRLRDDVVMHTNQREQLQDGAPQVSDGLYLVPKVIE